MKRKGEIAMLFSQLEDSQIESVVGGASNTLNGIQIDVSAIGIGDNVTVVTNANTQAISFGDYSIAFGYGFAYGFAITKNH